jgi:hypothetical protein
LLALKNFEKVKRPHETDCKVMHVNQASSVIGEDRTTALTI